MSVEGFFRNMQKEPGPGNYEKYREQSAALFLTYDTDVIAAKPGVDSDSAYLYYTFAGHRCRVSRKTADVEIVGADGTAAPAGFNECLVIYDILACSSADAHPANDYTMIQNLSDMLTSKSYAGKGMFDDIAQRFAGREKELAAACESLGGVPFGKGDVSYKIPLLRDGLSAVVSYWSPDDEFPASLNFLADKNLRQYMHYETVWYLAGFLFHRLESIAGI